METIYLAGGCFWGAQKFFDQFDGVKNTTVGYANGEKENPTYEEVCNDSGHAETVKIEYDAKEISTAQILEYYFMIIDPTSMNKQGEDEGIQYRTGIYYEDDSLQDDIENAMAKEQKKYDVPLAVEVMPLQNFYLAEEYHQKYLDKNPTGYCHVSPALLKLNAKKKSL
ncbi:MAG: peptide-methionine (S)-S-oxide reductase MsrA [Lachnospiraceae bacterium]|nr:peptide-methionine (S)-S-oxide reductase MsrA [Lachnospiraceae bacterium]